MAAIPIIGYMEDAYLAEHPYLAGVVGEFLGMQVNQKIVRPDDDGLIGMQAKLTISDLHNMGMQTNLVRTHKTGMEINFFLYNTSQLRILCDFPSRGVANRYAFDPVSLDNANWKSLQTLETSDKGKLSNLNTDVTEQYVQTADGVLFWELRCDTGAINNFEDTVGILDHNITSSATIVFQGSNSPTFSTVLYQFNVTPNDPYSIYIAPTIPNIPSRYKRFLITDNTNPDNHIRIGTIVFGGSRIFSPRETFDNPVTFGRKHFKDSVNTEGFTNKSNDRAIRRVLGLNFNSLDVRSGNYKLMQEYFEYAKTDLKCLIIPTPENPQVLTVWSKLTQLPEESHAAIDATTDELNAHWASLSLDWDEGE